MSRITDSQARDLIHCTNTTAHRYNPPTAVYSCIGCEKHLCDSCNKSLHKSSQHVSARISELKSYIVFDKKLSNESHIRRNFRALNGPDKFDYKINGCSTLYETFQRSVKLYGSSECLGQRGVNSDGTIGPYSWLTYKQISERVNKLSNGLVELGAKQKDRIGLYSINRPEWVIAEYACYNQSIIPVPVCNCTIYGV